MVPVIAQQISQFFRISLCINEFYWPFLQYKIALHISPHMAIIRWYNFNKMSQIIELSILHEFRYYKYIWFMHNEA
jgi:hypothetical protein